MQAFLRCLGIGRIGYLMTEQFVFNAARDNNRRETVLLICDPSGRLQSASACLGSIPVTRIGESDRSRLHGIASVTLCSDAAQKHFAELFGGQSAITRWLSDQIKRALTSEEYHSESTLTEEGTKIRVKIETLLCRGVLSGFAVHITEDEPGPSEGAAIVTREQWHEIKNQLGGLKLYATFLGKKLPEGDDRKTVEKLLKGVNGLIDELARIRRGEKR